MNVADSCSASLKIVRRDHYGCGGSGRLHRKNRQRSVEFPIGNWTRNASAAMEGKTNVSRYSPVDITRLHAKFGYEQKLRPASIPSLLWGFESLSSTSEPRTRGGHDNCARGITAPCIWFALSPQVLVVSEHIRPQDGRGRSL